MDTKGFLSSKTIWGLIVATLAQFLPAVFSRLGLGTDAATQLMLVTKIVTGIGIVFAAYGRWVATKPLSTTGGPKALTPAA